MSLPATFISKLRHAGERGVILLRKQLATRMLHTLGMATHAHRPPLTALPHPPLRFEGHADEAADADKQEEQEEQEPQKPQKPQPASVITFPSAVKPRSLAGEVVFFAGTFDFPKPKLCSLAVQCGGRIVKAVSAVTTIAVRGKDVKEKTAAKLGEMEHISSMNIAAFFKLVADSSGIAGTGSAPRSSYGVNSIAGKGGPGTDVGPATTVGVGGGSGGGGGGGGGAAAARTPVLSAAALAAADDFVLPGNTTAWRKTTDKATGKDYWWHRLTKEVCWDTPKEIVDFVREEMDKHAQAKAVTVAQLSTAAKHQMVSSAERLQRQRAELRGNGNGGGAGAGGGGGLGQLRRSDGYSSSSSSLSQELRNRMMQKKQLAVVKRSMMKTEAMQERIEKAKKAGMQHLRKQGLVKVKAEYAAASTTTATATATAEGGSANAAGGAPAAAAVTTTTTTTTATTTASPGGTVTTVTRTATAASASASSASASGGGGAVASTVSVASNIHSTALVYARATGLHTFTVAARK